MPAEINEFRASLATLNNTVVATQIDVGWIRQSLNRIESKLDLHAAKIGMIEAKQQYGDGRAGVISSITGIIGGALASAVVTFFGHKLG